MRRALVTGIHDTWFSASISPIAPASDDECGAVGAAETGYSEKTYLSVILYAKPTWPDPGSNPARRGAKPATNRPSHGTALNVSVRRLCG
jgi:hypothetical protein